MTLRRKVTSVLVGAFAVTMMVAGIGQTAQTHKTQAQSVKPAAKMTVQACKVSAKTKKTVKPKTTVAASHKSAKKPMPVKNTAVKQTKVSTAKKTVKPVHSVK